MVFSRRIEEERGKQVKALAVRSKNFWWSVSPSTVKDEIILLTALAEKDEAIYLS